MILDWKKIAEEIYNELKKEISKLEKKPSLSVIFVWNNESSIRYVKQKEKWAKYVWINFKLLHFDETISENWLLKEIENLNNDENINWFIIQLPLPNHINTTKIINSISPKKDVDWFHPINQWKIVIWDNSWLPACTPAWIIELLERYNIEITWKNIVIIWASNIVGKPTANLLINKKATVTICNSKTKDITDFSKNTDILITATW